jgi:hypothetical protein
MDETDLISSIAKGVQDTWRDAKRPFLISNVPRLLEHTDFRTVLGEESIKSFIKRTRNEGGYDIVEDSNHRARIGIVPAGEAYAFPPLPSHRADGRGDGLRQQGQTAGKGETMMNFLALIGELTEEEQRSVVIPVNIIAKLLQK